MQKAVRPGDWKLNLLSNEDAVIDSLRFRVEEIDHDISYEREILK
jgi:hypothetical protein